MMVGNNSIVLCPFVCFSCMLFISEELWWAVEECTPKECTPSNTLCLQVLLHHTRLKYMLLNQTTDIHHTVYNSVI